MALTGPLAPNGKQALLGAQIWAEQVNAKGGLLGRQVQLVNYDDQSNPSTVPGIYTKLLDVDKCDLVVSGYATNMVAPAIPVVMQRGKVFIGLFALDANGEFHYPKYFSMLPSGPTPKESFTEGFFQVAAAQNPKPQTIAIAAEDADFSHNAADGARANVKKYGLKTVYDKTYPPNTTDFSPIVRAIQAANADLVVICSYPLSSVGIALSANELGLKPKMFGGAMVGLQATVFKNKLKSKLNGIVNYETWVPSPKLMAPAADFFKDLSIARAGPRHRSARLLPRRLGLRLFPGAATGHRRHQEHQRRQARRLHARAMRSIRSWRRASSSAKTANGPNPVCCRCSITASPTPRTSRPGAA